MASLAAVGACFPLAVIPARIAEGETEPERIPRAAMNRLYFGRGGKRIVGFDNERGKGDHRHLEDKEEPYVFTTVEALRARPRIAMGALWSCDASGE